MFNPRPTLSQAPIGDGAVCAVIDDALEDPQALVELSLRHRSAFTMADASAFPGVELPLPDGVACYTVAATTAARRSPLADRLVGDGLVPLRSALGQHDDPRFMLAFEPASQFIAWRTGHLALLRSPEVAQQMLRWLAPGTR